MSLLEAARLGGVVEAVCEVADTEGMKDDLEIPIWPRVRYAMRSSAEWPRLTVGLFRALSAAIAAEMATAPRIDAALAEAREEGERVGAERERRACWELAERERATYENRQPSAPTQSGRATHASIFAGLAAGAAFIRDAIAARGPLGEP